MDPARVGRRAFVILYAVMVAWSMIAGFVSVIPQVFWPERGVPQEPVADCEASLRQMRDQLVFDASVALHGVGDDGRTFASQLSTFDARMLAMHDACGERAGYDTLFAYRYTLAMEVERHHDDVAPRARSADALFPTQTESTSP